MNYTKKEQLKEGELGRGAGGSVHVGLVGRDETLLAQEVQTVLDGFAVLGNNGPVLRRTRMVLQGVQQDVSALVSLQNENAVSEMFP